MSYRVFLIGLIFLLLNLNCKILQSNQAEQKPQFDYFIDGKTITIQLLSDLFKENGKRLNLFVRAAGNLPNNLSIKKEEVYVVYIKKDNTPSWSETTKLKNDSSIIIFSYPNEIYKNSRMLFRLKYSIYQNDKFIKTGYDETVFIF
ncbi:hypothetical protein [Adhaeribacter soli]|uniref:Lipoprotein n=1 Tax=Adhaeribacter soli TaxID=2607655 RepID=A0A5N1J5E1_9BACT|nr:hypothetical protein [Adhaeribacter soli]KAA9345947.1 hypothetical protein F0P94_02370 [Adhaeribacter soli]